MREINLTQGFIVQVDDHWYDYLMQWKWRAHKGRNTWYAARGVIGDRGKTVYMHRVIMATPDDQEVDHQDGNGLNCFEDNMRNCTRSQNSMNMKAWGKSKYKGVYIYGKKAVAQINVNKKRMHLGSFDSEEDAARARDAASIKYFGEFAYLNFPL